MIPKKIHYVWVGPNKQPLEIQKCRESWKRYAPDYETYFWNEKNAPMDHPYVQTMYEQKKWAFVSDYIRFWALEKEGGIYLDTDMELLKPIDSFLENEVFLGRAKSGHASAGIIGAIPHHPFIQSILEWYNTDAEHSIQNTSPLVIEKILKKDSFSGVQVYPSKYFYPLDAGESSAPKKLTEAYATHHWAESWVPFRTLRKFLRKIGILTILKYCKGKKDEYNPLVSVAMTTYNGGEMIRLQVNSILNQTYSNLELVISDDGSDQETVALLNEFALKDKRVRWSKNPSERGFIKNTENAIKLCKGDIIFLCDQDDEWYLDKIQQHVEKYRDKRVSWVFNKFVITDENGKITGYIEERLPDYYRNKTMLENAWGSCIGGAQTSYRAHLLKRVMPVDKNAPAHDSWIQLALNPLRGVFIDKILQTYRQHEKNQVGLKSEFSHEELVEREAKAIEDNLRYLKSLSKNKTLPLVKRFFFAFVYFAKRVRKMVPFIKQKSFITP